MAQDKSQISEPKYLSLVRGIGYSFKKGWSAFLSQKTWSFRFFVYPVVSG